MTMVSLLRHLTEVATQNILNILFVEMFSSALQDTALKDKMSVIKVDKDSEGHNKVSIYIIDQCKASNME